MTVRLHFVEHASMVSDGLTAITTLARSHLGSTQHFTDAHEFIAALATVEAAMQAEPDQIHMLVICTHGWEDTGTWLDMGENQPPFAVLSKLFSTLACETLIYMAVCWGGYAGTISRIQACQPVPVVVGALAPLTAGEGNQLQDALLDVLLADGLNEAKLASIVQEFNTQLRSEYAQEVARIATRDKKLEPVQGKAGLAWSLLRRSDDSPHEGPFVVVDVDGQVATISDGEKPWQASVGWLALGKRGPITVGDRFTFKAKVDPRNEVLKVLPPARCI